MQGTVLDFFGVAVKAHELIARVEELQFLARRIARYKDPVRQYRIQAPYKKPQWSASCGWTESNCCQTFCFVENVTKKIYTHIILVSV
jgi:chromodomain-helicase-DNA-binding protein 1